MGELVPPSSMPALGRFLRCTLQCFQARGLLILALCVGLLPSSAAAQASGIVDNVSVQVEAPWPNRLNKGYAPFWITLRNDSGRAKTVDLELKSDNQEGRMAAILPPITLEPGKVWRREVYAPTINFHRYRSTYTLTVRSSGDVFKSPSLIELVTAGGLHSVMIFSGDGFDAAAHLTWDKTLKTGEIADSGFSAFGSTRSSNPNVVTSTADWDRMPSRFQSYTSLDVVVLDATSGEPAREQVAVLARWLRIGGRLVILGEGALEFAQGMPDLAPWLGSRFLLEDSEEGSIYSASMGLLYVGKSVEQLFKSNRNVKLTQRAFDAKQGNSEHLSHPQLVPAYRRARNGLIERQEIPGLGELPIDTFMGLLLMFVLIIGPANFLMVSRLKRPGLLLLSIPAVSIVASGALLAYGVFNQGLELKASTHSITVLDQRVARAATVEEGMLYAGISPGRLRPDAGTVVMPLYTVDRYYDTYELDASDGSLSSAFLPVRTEHKHTILSERASRLRLTLSVDDEGLATVENGLTVNLTKLILRTHTGDWYWLEQGLKTGERMELEPLPAAAGSTGLARSLGVPLLARRSLIPGSYAAVMESSPFTDDCGMEMNILASNQAVYGILAAPGDQELPDDEQASDEGEGR